MNGRHKQADHVTYLQTDARLRAVSAEHLTYCVLYTWNKHSSTQHWKYVTLKHEIWLALMRVPLPSQRSAVTFDLQNLSRSSAGASGYFLLSFINTAQAVHEIWCSQDLTSTACCDLDLWPPESNQVIIICQWILPVSFIKIVQAVHKILW